MRKSIPSSLSILNENSHKSIKDDMKQSIASDGAGRKFSRTGSLLVTTNICKWFRHLFLNSSYPLRRQMLLTFGTVSSLTILLVMIVSIIASIATGNVIKEETNTNVEQWIDGFAGELTYINNIIQTLIFTRFRLNQWICSFYIPTCC